MIIALKNVRTYLTAFFLIAWLAFIAQEESRIQNLNAVQVKDVINLNFILSPGNSCSGYLIQRADEKMNFETIFEHAGTCGDQIKSQFLSYTDERPLNNIKNYYRIFIPPSDYSKIISAEFYDFSAISYILYSNPVEGSLKILVDAPNSDLELFNQDGRKLYDIKTSIDGSFSEDVSSLSKGLYYFTIKTKNGRTLKGNFLKN